MNQIIAQIVREVLALKKRPKEELTPGTVISRAYVVDAARLLEHSHEKFLPSHAKRRLMKFSYRTGERLDEALDKVKAALKKAKFTSVDSLIEKAKKLKIRNIQDVDKKWADKFDLVDKIVIKSHAHLKDVVSKKESGILIKYAKTPESAMRLLGSARSLPVGQPYVFVATWAIKVAKKYAPKLIDKLQKEDLSEEDKKFVKDTLNPKKIAKEDMELFTKKGHKPLWKPIKPGSEVKYNPKWDPKTDDTWYALVIDPSSGTKWHNYTKDFRKGQDKGKWSDVTLLTKAMPKINKALKAGMKSDNERDRVLALVVTLVDKGNFRIGNAEGEADDVRGLHNLLVKNIKLLGKDKKTDKFKVRFTYTGKKMVKTDRSLLVGHIIYEGLEKLVKGKKPDDNLFTVDGKNIGDNAVRLYLKKIGSPVTSIHKFRHKNATNLAKKYLLDEPDVTPKDKNKRKKAYLKETLEKIQNELGHESASTTKKFYIDPEIVTQYEKNMKIEEPVKANISLVEEVIGAVLSSRF